MVRRAQGGIIMKYEITAQTESGKIIDAAQAKTVRKASSEARTMAYRLPSHYVFVTWFRASDGQQGYLNPCGHEPTGKRW